MLRAAATAVAIFAFPALAHADPPGMTPPVGSAPSPGSAPTTYAPPTTSAPTTYAPAPAPTAPGSAPTYAPAPPPTYAPPAPTYAQPSQFAAPPASSYNPSYYPAPPAGPIGEQPLPAAGKPTYRGWTIGADLAAVTLFGLAVNKQDEDLLALSVGTYLLGAPLVHAVKGRTGNAFASVGLRAGLPLLGAMIGEALHPASKCVADSYPPQYYDDCGDEGPSDQAVLGAIVGIGAAMVIDSAYLARGDKPKAPPQPQWAPTMRASQGGFALGAAGSF